MDTRRRAAANDAAISDAVERARSSVFTDDAVEGLAADDFEPVMNARAARWQTHLASTNDVLDGSQPTTTSCRLGVARVRDRRGMVRPTYM